MAASLPAFAFYRSPRLIFGEASLHALAEIAARFGREILFITGGAWLRHSGLTETIIDGLHRAGCVVHIADVKGEPSPAAIDGVARAHRARPPACVVAVGGGSVIDAGKAIAAMLTVGEATLDYLEDVGTREHPGTKVPFVAVPTTAGTGSEASANAVLSAPGGQGYKKSLRHANFVPDVAIVDPALTRHCPPGLTAACGMDALSQLLESYVSSAASPLTDSLAFDALRLVLENLLPVCTDRADDPGARAALSYGAFVSGITLANAGLGVVHGLAGPIGGLHRAPHGALCGTLVAPAMRATIAKLRTGSGAQAAALHKFATVGALIAKQPAASPDYCCDLLVDTLDCWTDRLRIPTLVDYGITRQDCDAILQRASNKNNPVILDKDEMTAILHARC
jgi:alcohol dehydrogenase